MFTHPWTQAILTGAITVIPARNYPRLLRQSLIWTPPIIGSAAAGYLNLNRRARHKLLGRLAASQSVSTQEQPTARNDMLTGQQSRAPRNIQAAIAGALGGAVISVGMAVGFWADEQLERGLRRLKVPAPRLVMAVTAGAVTWWDLRREARNK